MPISLWKRWYHRPSLYPSTAALRSATAGRAGWDMELEESSRRKYRLSPNFRRWNHQKWPWHAPAKKAKGVQGAHGAAATPAPVPAPPPAIAPVDATDATKRMHSGGNACLAECEREALRLRERRYPARVPLGPRQQDDLAPAAGASTL